jgi:hypothetical protein
VRPSRDLAVLAGLVVLLIAGVLVFVRGDRPVGPPYRLDGHGPQGLSGLEAGLEAAGIDVHSGRRPTMSNHGLTITVRPVQFSIDEARSWVEAVRDGGTLLLVTDRQDALTEALGLRIAGGGGPAATPAGDGSRAFPGAQPGAFADPPVFTTVPPTAERLWQSGGGAVMAVFPLGHGSVWAVSDPRWFTNTGIAQAGLAVALPLTDLAGEDVTVDEYHHGVSQSGGTFGYLPGWLQLVVVQLGIVLAAGALTAARRLGPVRPAREPETRSTAELASSLARLHRKAGQLRSATLPLAESARRRFGESDPGLARAIGRLEHAGGERQAVEACAEIEQATRRLSGANR